MDDIDSRFMAILDRMHPEVFVQRTGEGMFKVNDLPRWCDLERNAVRLGADPLAFYKETSEMWDSYRSLLQRDPYRGAKTLKNMAENLRMNRNPEHIPDRLLDRSALPSGELLHAHRILLLETMWGYVDVTGKVPPPVDLLIERVGDDDILLYRGLIDAIQAAKERLSRSVSKESEEAYRSVVEVGKECLDRLRNGADAEEVREEFSGFLDYLDLEKDDGDED